MAKKPSGAKNKIKAKIIDEIDADDAFAILRILASEDKDIERRIEKIAMEYLSEVDIDDVADQVFFDLDFIKVEDVWDNSGSTRDGYVDPTEYAWEIFEDALRPYQKEIEKYQNLSMLAEANSYFKGLLKGLYKFENESTSEYKDWAVDAPKEYFEIISEKWKKSCKDPKEVEDYVRKNFPDW